MFFKAMRESEQMPQRRWLCFLLLLGACGRASSPPPDLFPATVAGVWRRTAVETLSASAAPDPVPRTVIDWLQVAAYEGAGKIETRVYGLASTAVALDLVQRWHPSADTVFFYRGTRLVVLKWQEADRKSLEAFIREFESRL
jgi:hypothetical protein